MTITEGRVDDTHRVVVRGRLDVRAVPDLRVRMHRIIDGGAERVLLDLTDAVIGDSTGLGVLVECVHRSRRAGVALLVATDDERTARLLRRARLGSALVEGAGEGLVGVHRG